ncbi:hypothetical protein A9976_10110 [Delftia sp. UME58]|nr:hypothetical protein [Delftia sp. UME58]
MFGYTYMHMAPTPTVGQMAVLLRLLEANIDVILTQKKVELTVDVKAELEKSLIQIHLMNKLSDAITQQDKSLFDATVVELEQTIPA